MPRIAKRTQLTFLALWLFALGRVAVAQPVLRVPVVQQPPHEYQEEDGRAEGMVPALLENLGRRMGREVEFIRVTPRAAQRGVRMGRFDVHVMARTDELAEEFQFAPTVLFYYRQVLLASPNSTAAISSLADITGHKVAVPEHDVAEVLLRRHSEIDRITVPDYETGMQLVADGNADYFLGNHDVCVRLINSGRAPHLRPVLTNILRTPACFAVSRKGPPEFGDAVAVAAEAMAADGTLGRLNDLWLAGEVVVPKPAHWIVRHLKIILAGAAALVAVLTVFVVLLRSLVKKQTRNLYQAQRSLRQSEERYRQVFNTANEAILVMDMNGHIQACSDQVFYIHGYRPHELIGQHVRILHEGGREDRIREDIDYLIRHGSRVHQVENVRKDGTRIQVELSERIILWEQNPVIVSCVTDITVRKEAEEALRASEEKLARAQRMEMAAIIAGQIAHDFNNLLSPLLGLPDLIKPELPEGSMGHQDLELIRMSAQRMGEISQQLLTLGRRGHYNQVPLDFNRVVREALAGVTSRLPPSCELTTEFDEDLPRVKGGASQLMRAISNLLWNAVEAMDAKGALFVSAARVTLTEPVGGYDDIEPGDYVCLTIKDTGSGIPEAVQEKIFEPFYTTKQSPRQRGHGLGLSIVHGVVKDHHGYINLKSLPGRGTTFFLYFPVCLEPVHELPAVDTVHGTETILVVDDDALQVEVYQRILASLGYSVTGVGSGERALSVVKENERIDLVLLDMVLESGWDGAETFRRIREVRPDLPVILVTGYAEVSVVAEAQKVGAGPVLRKPLAHGELAEAVRYQLDARKPSTKSP